MCRSEFFFIVLKSENCTLKFNFLALSTHLNSSAPYKLIYFYFFNILFLGLDLESDEENAVQTCGATEEIPFSNSLYERSSPKNAIISPVFKENSQNILKTAKDRTFPLSENINLYNNSSSTNQTPKSKSHIHIIEDKEDQNFITPKKLYIDENKNVCSQNSLTPLTNLKLLLHAVSPDIRELNKSQSENILKTTHEVLKV